MKNSICLVVSVLFFIIITGLYANATKSFCRLSMKATSTDSMRYTMSIAGYNTYNWLYGGPTWT